MKTFFTELLDYNQWATEKVLQTILSGRDQAAQRTTETANHILLVQLSWNNRMEGKEGLKDTWLNVTEDQWLAMNKDNTEHSHAILRDHDLDELFDYRTGKGESFRNSYRDILFHIINHGTYHRGQINYQLRSAGLEPAIIDYSLYKR